MKRKSRGEVFVKMQKKVGGGGQLRGRGSCLGGGALNFSNRVIGIISYEMLFQMNWF